MKRINIGVVGLTWGRIIANQIASGPAKPYFNLSAVCDINREKADTQASDLGVQAYYDVDNLLANKDIPAIALMTGPNGRADLIRKIIHAGKDVMTTKPFESDPDKALAILKEARTLKRVLHMNSPSPVLSAGLRQVKQWQEKFNLGRPIACRAETYRLSKDKADGRWIDDPDLCPAAPITRIGIYLINDMVRLLGPAEKVNVLQSRIFTDRPTPDNAQLSILFKSGAMGNVFASYSIGDGQDHQNSLTMNFENGTVYRNIMEPTQAKLGARPSKLTLIAKDPSGKIIRKAAEFKEMSGRYQWEIFYRAHRGEPFPDEVTPEEVVEGIKILNAMARAAKSGKSEQV